MTQCICDFCNKIINEKGHKVFLENHYPDACIGRIRGYNVADIDLCDECYYKHILNNLHVPRTSESTS